MKLNGIDIKLPRKPKGRKVRLPLTHAYSRWESAADNGANVTLHRQLSLAIARAVQLRGRVRVVSYLPDGIVQHGEWRAV
jgi:hypothetical protein